MRVNRAMVIVVAALALGIGLGASDESIKIGVVDPDQAVSATEEGKQARDEFERKKREAEAQLAPLHERAQEMLKEFEAKRFVLSDDALFQKQLDLAELKNQIENKRKEIYGQLQVDRERLLGPLQKKLQGIVEEIGRKEGFTLILQSNTPGILYTREALDITDLVIEKFNKKG
jgi:outer membrane protein